MPEISPDSMRIKLSEGFTPKSIEKENIYGGRRVFLLTSEKKINKLLTLFNFKLLFKDASAWAERLKSGTVTLTCSCKKKDMEEMVKEHQSLATLFTKATEPTPFLDAEVGEMLEDLHDQLDALDEPVPEVHYTAEQEAKLDDAKQEFISRIPVDDLATIEKLEHLSLADIEVLKEVESAIINVKQAHQDEQVDDSFFLMQFPREKSESTDSTYAMLFPQEEQQERKNDITVYLKCTGTEHHDDRCLAGKRRFNLDMESYKDILTKLVKDPALTFEFYG